MWSLGTEGGCPIKSRVIAEEPGRLFGDCEVVRIGMDVYVEEMPRQAQAASWIGPNHEFGYFRDCYNSYSLANWLSQNMDENVRGYWGLPLTVCFLGSLC